MADAEAIAEAAQRSTMRFVPVKSEESQAAALIFRNRDPFARQRTQLIKALRGRMGEVGLVVLQGTSQASRLVAMVADADAPLPDAARAVLQALVFTVTWVEIELRSLKAQIVRQAREDQLARRLTTIPAWGR